MYNKKLAKTNVQTDVFYRKSDNYLFYALFALCKHRYSMTLGTMYTIQQNVWAYRILESRFRKTNTACLGKSTPQKCSGEIALKNQSLDMLLQLISCLQYVKVQSKIMIVSQIFCRKYFVIQCTCTVFYIYYISYITLYLA